MTDLAAVVAIGGAQPETARLGALALAEDPGLALASLALRRGGAMPGIEGLTLPGPGMLAAGGGLGAFWTGPESWMIEGPGLAATDFAARIAQGAPAASVTEQTDAWVAFDIRSDAGEAPIRQVLERLVNLDPATLAAGRATRTALHHLPVFVLRRAEDWLTVLGMRSMAGSLWQVLQETAARQARRQPPTGPQGSAGG